MPYYPEVFTFDTDICNKMKERFSSKENLSINDPNKYPIRVLTEFPVHISFGKSVRTPEEALRINEYTGIANSIDKLKAKELWKSSILGAHIPTYIKLSEVLHDSTFLMHKFIDTFSYKNKFVLKLIKGSEGRGLKFCPDLGSLLQEVVKIIADNKVDEYFIEEYIPFDAEYRFHISPWLHSNWKCTITYSNMETGEPLLPTYIRLPKGLIWAVKKTTSSAELASYNSDAIEFRHRLDLITALKQKIVDVCVQAAQAQQLDFAAYDVIVANNDFYILESNSNPSLTNADHLKVMPVEQQAYCQAFPHIIKAKAKTIERFKNQTVVLL
jgi:hypothetical protein